MATAQIKLPPKLVPVFTGEASVRGAYGGRGSGKTRTFAKMSAVRAYMWDMAGREGIVLCLREFMNSLDDSSMEEVKAAIRAEPWLEAHFEIGEKFIRTKSGRIAYKFAGLDRNIDSIKSKSRILLSWVDEAEPVSEEAYAKLIPTLREEDSELWVTWNPESPRSATHKRFRLAEPDPRVKIVEINWRDNPWFPSILDRVRLKDKAERPDTYGHVWEGEFAVAFEGAYYAKELIEAKEQGRIGNVPYDPVLPVHTAWDLGVGDQMSIWFFQLAYDEIRVIDYYENKSQGFEHYANVLKDRGYAYGTDWVPHDARVQEMGTGRSRIETLISMGRNPAIVPSVSVDDGINATRLTLRRCWFDETKCAQGLECLRHYRTELVEKHQVLKPQPLHNWASHGADAFRYLSLAWSADQFQPEPEAKPLFKPMHMLTYEDVLALDEPRQASTRV